MGGSHGSEEPVSGTIIGDEWFPEPQLESNLQVKADKGDRHADVKGAAGGIMVTGPVPRAQPILTEDSKTSQVQEAITRAREMNHPGGAIGDVAQAQGSPGHGSVPEPKLIPATTSGGSPHEHLEVLKVITAATQSGSLIESPEKNGKAPLKLGCAACNTSLTIDRAANELLYLCKTCKKPLGVMLECRACGNQIEIAQDEYRAAGPAGKHCPVCLEKFE
jgi:hypothetical protein